MAHAAFKKGLDYPVIVKPRVIIQKPELNSRSISLQEPSRGNSVGVFYKALLILAAGCSLASLWLAFQA